MEYEVLGLRLHSPATGQYPELVSSTRNPTTHFFNITPIDSRSWSSLFSLYDYV
jgi:hypothetical protein